MDLFWVLKEKNKHTELEVLVVAAWGIWNNRNKVQHGDTSKTAAVIVNNARRYIEEYKQATNLPVSPPHPHPDLLEAPTD